MNYEKVQFIEKPHSDWVSGGFAGVVVFERKWLRELDSNQ